jgi:hypothetical protein
MQTEMEEEMRDAEVTLFELVSGNEKLIRVLVFYTTSLVSLKYMVYKSLFGFS